jgi:hypothetical protein
MWKFANLFGGTLTAWWFTILTIELLFVNISVGGTFSHFAPITFLSTLVPGFTDSLKYAVVAGAVSGGGLTVIANAPNPAVNWH